MSKQLHQVEWDLGQVDGDNRRAMVTELLNVEMDNPGALRSRDTLVRKGDAPEGAIATAHIDTKTLSGSDASGWDIVFMPTSVLIWEIASDGSRSTVPQYGLNYPIDVGTLDSNRCEVVIYGEKVFFCMVNTDNEPLGVCMIYGMSSGERFRPLGASVGTDYEPTESQRSAGTAWLIRMMSAYRPPAVMESFQSFSILRYQEKNSGAIVTDYYGIGKDGIYRDETYETSIGALRSSIPNGGVGLLATVSPEEEGLYGANALVEYMVQYRYMDGSYSALSDPMRVNFSQLVGTEPGNPYLDDNSGVPSTGFDVFEHDPENDLSYGCHVGLVVPETIPMDVKQVLVYKRVIDYDNQDLEITDSNDLLFSADVFVDADDDTSFTPSEFRIEKGFGWLINHQVDSLYYGTNPPDKSLRINRLSDTRVCYSYSTQMKRFVFPSTMLVKSGTGIIGNGWIHVGGGSMVYVPKCFGILDGDTEFGTGLSYGLSGPSRVYLTCSDAHLLVRSRGATQFPVAFAGGVNLPVYNVIDGSSNVHAVSAHVMLNSEHGDTGPGTGIIALTGITASTYLSLIRNKGVRVDDLNALVLKHDSADCGCRWVQSDSVVRTASQRIAETKTMPMAFFIDFGRMSTYTEESISGVLDENIVDVKPRHIAVSGGRLFGLNGIFNGIDEETRLFYSQYGSYSAFDKDMFIDYGSRNDGVGKAISGYRNKLVLHFSRATYTIDVAGGLDASWRELGAITGVGAVGIWSIVETPLGVFWYNGTDIMWFNGQSIRTVSYIPERKVSVRETLKEMVGGDHESVRLAYRTSMRQVWVSINGEALVLDIDTMAWHKHEFSEFSVGISAINGDGESESLHTSEGIYSFDGEAAPNFIWGITGNIDLGVPEIIKKIKRIYVQMIPDDVLTHEFQLLVSSGGISQEQTMPIPSGGDVVRAQASIRGRIVTVTANTLGGDPWRGKIESVGLSYKPKRVK